MRLREIVRTIGPGALLAATGVGAGDLATGALAGAKVGLALLWAVPLGALLKFVLNESIARWQLATGQSVLEGLRRHLGGVAMAVFLAYLLLWSFHVGAALMTACGVAVRAFLPPDLGTVPVLAALHGLLGLALVLFGRNTWFERVMAVCIAAMFVTVVGTAVALGPDLGACLRSLVPSPATLRGEPGHWSVALMGGVGGTVTILCYGDWIRAAGRRSLDDLRTCRIDLAVGYATTAAFGMAMVVIGSRVPATGKSTGLLLDIGRLLGEQHGAFVRTAFAVGAWCAVFSSLLGVWQAVPLLYADALRQLRRPAAAAATTPARRGPAATSFLVALTFVPMLRVFGGGDFAAVQRSYATIGAWFIPLLAVGLWWLLARAAWCGERAKHGLLAQVLLASAVLFFVLFAVVDPGGS